jgi:hypothetical protein
MGATQNDNITLGTNSIGDDLKGLENRFSDPSHYLAHLLGYTKTEILQSTNLTPVVVKNNKSISVDFDGFAKITYADPNDTGTITEVKFLVAGAEYHIRKITAWAAPTDTVNLPSARVVTDAESIVNGIKIHI